jgi:asparagine synthase (glutamine-hydrolysing)
MERGQAISLLRPTTPLLDKRVLEFCLAVPASMNLRNGYPRYLMRAALNGILPPKIQWRTSKAPFSPDYTARYNAQLGMARAFVAGLGARDPVRSIIDIERLTQMLVPADSGKESLAARDEVPSTLYMINFLRQFREFQP